MALKRHLFDVYVAPLDDAGKPDYAADPDEFLGVSVINPDVIRAELEGGKQGLPGTAAMTGTTLWVWAALLRTGSLDCKWTEFRNRCVSVQPGGEEDVDPTQPAPSGPPSDSQPSTAEDPATGSTPPSTTD